MVAFGVDGIVCLPILQIGGVRVHGWCRRGGGGDSIRCVSPSALSPLLRRYLRRHGGAGRFCRPEYAQTLVYASDSWKMVHLVLGLWLKADSSGFLLRRHSRVGVSVLEFDCVSGDMLPRSDSFNGNCFASSKLLWRSVKLLIGDVTVHGWCRRGGGGDSIRCVSPSTLSPLLRRYLRSHGGAGRFCRPGVRADACLRK